MTHLFQHDRTSLRHFEDLGSARPDGKTALAWFHDVNAVLAASGRVLCVGNPKIFSELDTSLLVVGQR